MKEWLAANERMVCLLGLLLLAAGVLFGLGRVELHNEIECEVYTDEFLAI